MLYQTFTLLFGFVVGAQETWDKNIMNVVNTTDRTWIYSGTRNGSEYKCAYYSKPRISCLHQSCFFSYFYYFEKNCTKQRETRVAEIQKECLVMDYRKDPCIVTRDNTTIHEIDSKVLLYWDSEKQCGVYKILPAPSRNISSGDPSGKPHCELHVRGKAIKERRTKARYFSHCEEKLYQLCNEEYIKLAYYSDLCYEKKH
ncbi:uncharacterized protein LOC119463799 [Dermacentor silvarum]|uniref:uncharacterized protein LOC119463799 n=1 Tax=Dermacentor silvarum TaxID=543639 RepID=UPI00210137BD|nr:uncharacterized protein LOC119463799 [Dermacentor silvarum]